MSHIIAIVFYVLVSISGQDHTPKFNPGDGFYGQTQVMSARDAQQDYMTPLFERLSYKYRDLVYYFG